MYYKVHNLREEQRNGDWIRYWENATGIRVNECHFNGCCRDATDGAHVQLVDGNNASWHIVPLCHRCNCQSGAEFYVEGPLVSAKDPSRILW